LSASHTSDPFARIQVRILTLPAGKLLEGIVDVARFKVGHSYEVGPRLAELLIASGHAALERRLRRLADSDQTGGYSPERRLRRLADSDQTGGDSPENG
jgi:hypothetical protein